MSVTITAYERVEPVDPALWPRTGAEVDAAYEAGCVRVGADRVFAQSYRGLPDLLGGADRIDGGWVKTEGLSLRVGDFSASGWTGFRRALGATEYGGEIDRLGDYLDAYRTRPFFELVYFSDQEGCIGREACTDLALDFATRRRAVQPLLRGDSPFDWHEQTYGRLAAGFALAAGTGMVVFA